MPGTMYAVMRYWGSHGTQVKYRFIGPPLIHDLLSEPGIDAVPKYMLAPPDEPEPPAVEAPRPRRRWAEAQPRRGGREVIPLDE